MSRNKTNNTYTQEQRMSLYMILQPATKEFYVHFSAAKELRSVYKEHYNFRNSYTKKIFEKYTRLKKLKYQIDLALDKEYCYGKRIDRYLR